MHTKIRKAEPEYFVAAGLTIDGLRDSKTAQVTPNEVSFYPLVPTTTRYVQEDLTWQYKNRELHSFLEQKEHIVFIDAPAAEHKFGKITKALMNANSTTTGLIFVADNSFVLIEEEHP